MSAYLFFTDGSKKVIATETGITIWQALNGEIEPTEKQAEFLPKIKDVFLPPSAQSDSYRTAHKHILDKLAANASKTVQRPPTKAEDDHAEYERRYK